MHVNETCLAVSHLTASAGLHAAAAQAGSGDLLDAGDNLEGVAWAGTCSCRLQHARLAAPLLPKQHPPGHHDQHSVGL